MKKDCYIYPAIFNYKKDGISISFPDLQGCNTCGDNDEDAFYMAKDALGLYIACKEDDEEKLPEPSKLSEIKLKEDEKVILVEVNMPLFRDAIENTAVKKTLTIPKWINDIAEKNKVNFSRVLQIALKEQLGISKKY